MTSWTKEEIQILEEDYPLAERVSLCQDLPRHSWSAIRRQAQRFKLSRVFGGLRNKKSNIPRLTSYQVGYIAGFMDGEGTFAIIKNKYRSEANYFPYITVTNTKKRPLEQIADWLKMGYVSIRHERHPRNHSDTYTLRIQRIVDVRALVEFLKPYLIIKKEQAELVQELASIKANKKITILRGKHGRVLGTLRRSLPREEEIYNEVRTLNKRGKPYE